MSTLKTRPTGASVEGFIDGIEPERKRLQARELVALMAEISGEQPVLWGDRLIGFGQYDYRQRSGREASWPLLAFGPGRQHLTIHIMPGFDDYGALLEKLGKFRTGKSCLYINKLEDVDRGVLRALIARSVADMRQRYG